MTIQFPTSLDTFTNPTATDQVAVVDHAGQHSNANDAIEALEAKVGANGSAVTTSHDYKLSGVIGTDKAVSKTGTETLTNKTLTSPTITGATITTSTIPESNVTFTDITTGDVSTTKHGFVPKAPNDTGKFLRGDGTWNAPVLSGSVQVASAATLSVTTTAGQRIICWAKGDLASSGSVAVTVTIKYNTTVKDTITIDQSDNGGVGWTVPFTGMYSEVPGAGTQNITINTSGGSINNPVIMVLII